MICELCGAIVSPDDYQTHMEKHHKPNFHIYPEGVEVRGNNVFTSGRYMGYVDRVPNWGTDFLARCEYGKPNKFFKTKTEAVEYLLFQEIT